MASLVSSRPVDSLSLSSVCANVLSFGGPEALFALSTNKKMRTVIQALLNEESSFTQLFKDFPAGKIQLLVRSYAKHLAQSREINIEKFVIQKLSLIFQAKQSYHGICQIEEYHLYRLSKEVIAKLDPKEINILHTDLFVQVRLSDSVRDLMHVSNYRIWRGDKWPVWWGFPGFSYIHFSYLENLKRGDKFEINWRGKKITLELVSAYPIDKEYPEEINEYFSSNSGGYDLSEYWSDRTIFALQNAFCSPRICEHAPITPSAKGQVSSSVSNRSLDHLSSVWPTILSFGGPDELLSVLRIKRLNGIVQRLLTEERSFTQLFKDFPSGKIVHLVRSYAKHLAQSREMNVEEFVTQRLTLIFQAKTAYYGVCSIKDQNFYYLDTPHLINLHSQGIDVRSTDLFVHVDLADFPIDLRYQTKKGKTRETRIWKDYKFPVEWEFPGFSHIHFSCVEKLEKGQKFEINWNGKRIILELLEAYDDAPAGYLGIDPFKFSAREKDLLKRRYCFSRRLPMVPEPSTSKVKL